MRNKYLLPFITLGMFAAAPVYADIQEYQLVIKDHQFNPSTLSVPSGKKVKVVVDNQDSTPEEFESHDLDREKIIAGNSKAIIYIGPLEPGNYKFFGEFNPDTAKGTLTVK